ncbi:MAG: TonB-dependent siderophore receptor [Alphaproteobacteria bacterium]|nr:TonB-dependent siderophore receptor [Alphaproteobacteria bacterium]
MSFVHWAPSSAALPLRSRVCASASVVGLSLALVTGTAFAQSAASTDQTKVEKVIVTGKKSAKSATKTDTPLKEIPQSVQVIPGSLIKDQNNLTVAETLRNVSGVQPTSPLQTPAYDSTNIRGFAAEQWLDGIASFYNAGDRDSLVNAERIEILKGPNAILYGGGSGAPLGGVVNVVSKLPTATMAAEIGARIGSFEYVQPYVDVNLPLTSDGTVLFRLTGDYTSAGSFIDVIDTDRYSLNPTLAFTDNAGTTLIVQGRISDWRQQEYQGLPATGTILGPLRLDRDLFVGPSDIPKSESWIHSLTAKLDHQFDDAWSASVQARFGQTKFEEVAQNYTAGFDFAGNVPAFGPSSWNVLNLDLFQTQDEVSVNGNVAAKFEVGDTRNTLLIGADYTKISDNGVMLGDFNDLFLLGLVDLTNPVYPAYVKPAYILANTIVDGDNTYTTKGAFVQIQSTVWERVHFLGGLRLTNLEIDSVSPAFALSSKTDTTKVLPRIGAVVDLTPEISLFADYSEGLKGNPFVFYLGAPKPERSDQTEAGIKFDFGFGLSGSVAVFEINRTGVPVFTGLASEAVGEQRSRGYDADLTWQPAANWFVLANYAHIDAELTNDVSGAGLAGNQLNIVPPDSGRLWVSYKFDEALSGWSIGAGLYAASDAFLDSANVYKTDGYVTFDARIGYDTEKYSASVSVKNLTDEKYFVPFNYYGGRVAPGDPIALYATLAVKLQ